jgi:site-specific DNA recombinase
MRQHNTSSRNNGSEGKRVGLWIRVSTEDQARGESPEHHETRGRMYAAAKGWTVLTVYHLEGVSGKSVMSHPEARRMLQDVERGEISGLIFSKLARLARNTTELLEFAAIFERHSADLISLAESIDTSTPAGRLFYTLIAAMATWEREEIASRVAASVPIRAKLGKKLGGAAPYGYAWEDGKLVPDEKEAPVRKLMYDLFRLTRRVRTVAGLLNEKGYRTRNGSLFTHATVRRLILDPTAKGVRRANYTKSLGDGKKWKLKPESEWVEVPVPAIVDEALWGECASILRERSEGWKPGPRPVHLFTGFVFCACGRKMYVPSDSPKSPKWTCYSCRNKIPVSDLERVFGEQLKGFVFSAEAIAEHFAQVDATVREKEGLLETLRREEASVRDEAEKLYRLYLEGGLSVQGFRERNDPLEKRKTELQAEVPRLQAEIDYLTVQLLGSAEALAEAQTLYERWETLVFEDKREIIETIVGRITVGDGEVEIDLAGLPRPDPTPQFPSSPKLAAERERIVKGSWPRGERTGPGNGAGRGHGPH